MFCPLASLGWWSYLLIPLKWQHFPVWPWAAIPYLQPWGSFACEDLGSMSLAHWNQRKIAMSPRPITVVGMAALHISESSSGLLSPLVKDNTSSQLDSSIVPSCRIPEIPPQLSFLLSCLHPLSLVKVWAPIVPSHFWAPAGMASLSYISSLFTESLSSQNTFLLGFSPKHIFSTFFSPTWIGWNFLYLSVLVPSCWIAYFIIYLYPLTSYIIKG